MNPRRSLAVVLALCASLPSSAQTLLGPSPYLSEADSPFGLGSPIFALENFEDHVFNVPGATIAGGFVTSVNFSGSIIDSVDGDDGVVNGACPGCDSYFAFGAVTVQFNATALGGLPTSVGIVWTDGGFNTTATFQAFDADGASLGTILAPNIGDSSNNGTTAEDRFFGISYAGGVQQIQIANVGAIEVDHVQYNLPGGPLSYCTPGTSASGCQVVISGSGTPSASSGSGFTLKGPGAEGSKTGLFFHGTGGRQAATWGNGTSFQCVVPPVKRSNVLSGLGTNGLCNGLFSMDFNAFLAAKPSHNPGAGAVVQTQLWYRDPLNTSNQKTSLSNALEFLLGP